MPQRSTTDIDVVIVGAGPAGSAAAYDLRLTGKSVLLLDRHEFPRHKACAGGLTVKTLRALRYPVDAVIRNRCRSMEIGKRFARPVQFSG
ncbi:MAG: FAD-dependent oxidoreductase, partial [Desulfobacterales bacterium]|nr:FAD-dependent oxidoreductase [Desulfobacterales bacterium]